ncbi:MAG: RlmE family RNA methyltransferase [Rhodospirillales bacterium]|nr:RlmE family RNA methyltransferase [Rhodospirillales bacterium]MCB9979851.1 RlmE family RNA methyltransferase [Rhodospirillales bacterium]
MSEDKKTPGKKPRVKHKRTARDPSQNVKTAKGRKTSSTQWLKRQLNDPYVREAELKGYRSRAAFKLLEIDEKLNFLRNGQVIVDLGAAPGGWSQVAAQRGAKVVAIDLLEIDELADVLFAQMDFTDHDAVDRLLEMLDGRKADVVLSDMAPNTIGHRQTDHLRIMALAELAYDFAKDVLSPGGAFVAKVLQGGAKDALLNALKKDFKTVRHIKPPASRKDSAEMYVVGIGFQKS